jgi:hypothetical protein
MSNHVQYRTADEVAPPTEQHHKFQRAHREPGQLGESKDVEDGQEGFHTHNHPFIRARSY